MKKQTLCIALTALCLLGSCASSRNYDGKPENRRPLMTKAPSANYNIQDDQTFAAYKNAYTVNAPEGKKLFEGAFYQLYRNKKATYVTATYRCPEDAWFYHFNSKCAIIDQETGDRYMLRGVEYFPTDTCFWINGAAGKYVRYVLEFPPLPKRVKVVDFFIPGTESRYNFDGNAKRENGLVVEELRPKTRTGKIIY